MPAVTPKTSSTSFDPTAQRVALLDALWPCVRVESVQVTSGPAVECARAVVHLGQLAPADVRVELIPAGSGTTPSPAAPDEHRMFSSHALENGSFVFEARLPYRDREEPQEWAIYVYPTGALEELRVEHRFRRDS